jgi:hypothetical protein
MGKNIVLTFHIFIMIITAVIILLSRFVPGYKSLLRKITAETGPFELGSAFMLLLLTWLAIKTWLRLRKAVFEYRRIHMLFIAAISIAAVLAAMEEISWGQHLLGFESPTTFAEYNRQQETNLHNFMPADLFNLTINLSVYMVFVYLPLFLHTDTGKKKLLASRFASLGEHIPSTHIVLMFIFAFSLQAYFRLETLADTLALIGALIFTSCIVYLKRNIINALEIIHLLVVWLLTVLFMICHEVFRYENMQYEIREFVFVYAFIYWFAGYAGSLMTNNRLANR